MVAGRRAAVEVGCEEVEEERARVGGDAVVLCLWLNVEPVRLRGDQSMRCAASLLGATAQRRLAPRPPRLAPPGGSLAPSVAVSAV